MVGEAGDVEEALALTETHQPRVIVLDLNMPGTPTLTAIPRFLEAAPGSAVVVLTMQAEPGFARSALSAGPRRRGSRAAVRDEALRRRPRRRLLARVRAVSHAHWQGRIRSRKRPREALGARPRPTGQTTGAQSRSARRPSGCARPRPRQGPARSTANRGAARRRRGGIASVRPTPASVVRLAELPFPPVVGDPSPA